MGIVTRADGQTPIPPIIVHQGVSGVVDADAHLIASLDSAGKPQYMSPQEFTIHQSPSGYMDDDGFDKLAVSFAKSCGPIRPAYLLVDGHDSHFSPVALRVLLENGIRLFFSRSQNSEQDAANDNGPNSKFRSIYNFNMDLFNAKHGPTVKLNKARVNEVIKKAWSEFQIQGPPAIVKGFERTGTFPLNRKASNYSASAAAKSSPFTGEEHSLPHAAGQLSVTRAPTSTILTSRSSQGRTLASCVLLARNLLCVGNLPVARFHSHDRSQAHAPHTRKRGSPHRD